MVFIRGFLSPKGIFHFSEEGLWTPVVRFSKNYPRILVRSEVESLVLKDS